MLAKLDLVGQMIDPIVAMIAQANGQDAHLTEIQPGYYTSPLNFGNIVGGLIGLRLGMEDTYPDLGEWDDEDHIPAFGVCDTPQQFIDKYGENLSERAEHFVVGFAHIKKDVSNKGQGGGWRWHKWGEYVGEGDSDCEYLDDEQGFEDGVYCFDILRIPPHAFDTGRVTMQKLVV